jgi:hypothetical protein
LDALNPPLPGRELKMDEETFLDDPYEVEVDEEPTPQTLVVPPAVRRLAARRSLEQMREKQALRMQLQDTFEDGVDLEELGW